MSRASVAAMTACRWWGVVMVLRVRSHRVIRLLLWPRPAWCRGRIRRGDVRSPASAPFRRPNWSAWRAVPSCSGCFSRARASRSGTGGASAPPRKSSAAPWLSAMAVACSARPSLPGVRPTTSSHGPSPPRVPPTSTIWPFSAPHAITACTTTSACSSEAPMAPGVRNPTPATPTAVAPVAASRTATGGAPMTRSYQRGSRWHAARGRLR